MSQQAMDRLLKVLPDAVIATHAQHGDETVIVKAARWLDAAHCLRDDPGLGFDMLIDITAFDLLGLPGNVVAVLNGTLVEGAAYETGRFQVVAHFRSTKTGQRIRLKATVGSLDTDGGEGDDEGVDESDLPSIDSLVPLYYATNWAEREIFDMYGVRFRGHPDLRRILMYEEFIGHPLRKDYPKEKRQPLVRRDYN